MTGSIQVGDLPGAPLEAAARFYAEVLPQILETLRDRPKDALIVFAPADYTHRGWRLAAVQQLARDCAPRRVNAVASDNPQAIDAVMAYLGTAEGVTGQYLPLDGNGAVGLLSRNE